MEKIWCVMSHMVREKSLRRSGRELFFSLVCMNVLHHVDKNALCSMSVRKFG